MAKELDDKYESLRNSTINFDTSDEEEFYSVVDKFGFLAMEDHVNSMRYIGHLFAMNTPFYSEKKSTRWFMMAIENGSVDSMMDIAREYKKGLIYKKDLHKALHFYQMAYDNGESKALHKINKLTQKIKKHNNKHNDKQ